VTQTFYIQVEANFDIFY